MTKAERDMRRAMRALINVVKQQREILIGSYATPPNHDPASIHDDAAIADLSRFDRAIELGEAVLAKRWT